MKISFNNNPKCLWCHTKDAVIKFGFRYNKNGNKQMYYCNNCRRKFTSDIKNTHYNSEIIKTVLNKYTEGYQPRKILEYLNKYYSINPSKSTVLRWVKKYS